MAATAPTRVEIPMSKEKDTKNTVRFEADDQDAPITSVYVQKTSELAKATKIVVTVEAG